MSEENKQQKQTAMQYDIVLYALLEKYVKYLMEAEGSDFIDKEWEILQEISEKVNYPNSI